ncbi:MAG: dimethylsulfoxide reductase subunit B [Anaerolineales bacterium]|nr:dimethylsulfoxide reductase subunit B [Anaerolineales bacterium]
MSIRYAFHLDLKNCTGCKACQIACKEKNKLPTGLLWRRVVEVCGGSWTARGQAWLDDTFTYFLSTSCYHCEDPICLEVCPTRAITQQDNGIVTVETDRCIGCHYCEWACPYGAPRFDPVTGLMSKCDFCIDLLEQGRPPACVAACQMRVLDFGDLTELKDKFGSDDPMSAFFPLPQPGLTHPAATFKLHADVRTGESKDASIANEEEIQREN